MSEIGNEHDSVRAIVWRGGALELLDQRLLPGRYEYLRLDEAAEVTAAIRDMVVRGAPAIGITAAYGVVLAARDRFQASAADWKAAVAEDLAQLGEARPTAVNLRWALARMARLIDQLDDGDPTPELLAEARQIHREDVEANHRMGELGAALIVDKGDVLTHCNAGALATGGYGTALGVIRSAHAQGKISRVYADETRPWFQGSRLTAWELIQDGIPVTLLAEGAGASLMQGGGIRWVIVGADRVAANGDVANKIGTYSAAVIARRHRVGFMVVAPTSTIDMATPAGEGIPIERRDPQELLACAGVPVAAGGAEAWNPVFDVTPAELVDALVTEKGVVFSPNPEKLAELMAK